MKEKAYDPARHNEQSPAPGMAAVNTHNESDEEQPIEEVMEQQKKSEKQEADSLSQEPAQ
jgi:hypothetical protein